MVADKIFWRLLQPEMRLVSFRVSREPSMMHT